MNSVKLFFSSGGGGGIAGCCGCTVVSRGLTWGSADSITDLLLERLELLKIIKKLSIAIPAPVILAKRKNVSS